MTIENDESASLCDASDAQYAMMRELNSVINSQAAEIDRLRKENHGLQGIIELGEFTRPVAELPVRIISATSYDEKLGEKGGNDDPYAPDGMRRCRNCCGTGKYPNYDPKTDWGHGNRCPICNGSRYEKGC